MTRYAPRYTDDLRYAARQLRKTPGFTVLVAVTIALGIGANTAIFSLINGFHRPFPVKDAQQLVVLAAQTPGDQTGFGYMFSWRALQDLRAQSDRFTAIAAFNVNIGGLNAGGKTAQFLYSAVTGDFFTTLGLRPVAGRLFVPGEGETTGSELLCILSDRYWQTRFGRDPTVVGREIRLDGKAARIVGITPPNFHGPYAGADMDGYLTLNQLLFPGTGDRLFTDRTFRLLTILGRMKPGVSLAEAQSSLDVIAHRLQQRDPDTDNGIGVRVFPETLARPVPLRFLAEAMPVIRGFLLLLAAMVLLLACMNVANLQLVRATIREREMAIRAALGSGRARLVRQMLAESLMLAALGGAAGLLIGKWASDAMAGTITLATDFPIVLDFSFDWRVFTYATIASLITGILIGLWPAIRVSRANASAVLHDGGWGGSGGPRRQRLRGLLIVGQVAGSLVLLIIAGLFVRNLRSAQQVDLGFRSDHLLNVRLNPAWAGYDQHRNDNYYREVERQVRALPGVESASLAFSVPMGYYFDFSHVFLEDRPPQPGDQPPTIGYNLVDSAYFDAMRIPLVRGRAFTDDDGESAPRVAIVNQTMAARLWPNQDPVGKRFRMPNRDSHPVEVVGVARDSKYLAVFEQALPYMYLPLAQQSFFLRVLQVRTTAPPERFVDRLRLTLRTVDPEVPIADLQTMDRALEGGIGLLLFRIGAMQAAGMGILGMVLAVIGVYGVVSYGAAQRTREIGIRMALGALPGNILRMILGQGLYLVAAGVVAGLAVAIALTRIIGGYLILASKTDPFTFIVVTIGLAGIALTACCIPARRAMRVDPMVALRHE